MLSREERRALMEANPPEIDDIFNAGAYFNWGWDGCGFGQLSFGLDRETGIITCSNECMSRESVRTILIAFANKIADTCVLDCDREAETIKENNLPKSSTIDVVKGNQFGYTVPITEPAKTPAQPELTEAELKHVTAKKATLVSQLQTGVWVVEFTKVDGTPSTMECTLDPRFMPPADDTSGSTRVQKPNLLHVYAVDRAGWRSFRVLNVSRTYEKV